MPEIASKGPKQIACKGPNALHKKGWVFAHLNLFRIGWSRTSGKRMSGTSGPSVWDMKFLRSSPSSLPNISSVATLLISTSSPHPSNSQSYHKLSAKVQRDTRKCSCSTPLGDLRFKKSPEIHLEVPDIMSQTCWRPAYWRKSLRSTRPFGGGGDTASNLRSRCTARSWPHPSKRDKENCRQMQIHCLLLLR